MNLRWSKICSAWSYDQQVGLGASSTKQAGTGLTALWIIARQRNITEQAQRGQTLE